LEEELGKIWLQKNNPAGTIQLNHAMKKYLLTLLILSLLTPVFAQRAEFKVLAFYSTNTDADHVSFSNDIRAFFKNLSVEKKFTFDATTDWTNLNEKFLSNYQAVIWINDFPRTDQQRAVFQKYMENGGGWLGFQSAGNITTTTKWPWFTTFMGGAVFQSKSSPALPARIFIDDPTHPIAKRIPPALGSPANEWYKWQPSPRLNKDVKVLATLDPNNYPLGMKDILTDGDIPVVWTNTKYNMIYLNIGSGSQSVSDYLQNKMIEDALLWVGKKNLPVTSATATATPITSLFTPIYPEMVSVQGGTYAMGDETGQNKDELPVHQVTVRSFKIAKTEVTVAQWRVFCAATNRKMPDIPNFGWQEERPIVNVSWDDAVAYCYWLDEKGGTFRLPTEAEWEFAARGGVKTKKYKYAGSSNIDSVAWYNNSRVNSPQPVGKKLPNELGLYDMAGNVYEWVNDGYDATYYANSPKENPSGPKTAVFYVLRSGGYDNEAFKSRLTYRNAIRPDHSNFNKGFRLASD
jgi:formylglycine-generating enzyme required for sulfatase activity